MDQKKQHLDQKQRDVFSCLHELLIWTLHTTMFGKFTAKQESLAEELSHREYLRRVCNVVLCVAVTESTRG
jgi:hypothetical protein